MKFQIIVYIWINAKNWLLGDFKYLQVLGFFLFFHIIAHIFIVVSKLGDICSRMLKNEEEKIQEVRTSVTAMSSFERNKLSFITLNKSHQLFAVWNWNVDVICTMDDENWLSDFFGCFRRLFNIQKVDACFFFYSFTGNRI